MNRFYNLPAESKERILNETGEKCNLPAYAVEKDWWVVQTLSILFELEVAKHLVFKGGTSLSKSWGLIERFSEDIDLAVDRTFYGFEGELTKERRTKLRKTANSYIRETLFPELQKAFAAKGLSGVTIELEEITTSDQDPVIINANYPHIIESPGYIRPRVQIEIGCRSLMEPFENRPLLSLVDTTYPETHFSQKPVNIPTVVPERTFLEKIFLLHEEFQRPPEKMRVNRLSRHLYDIYKLAQYGVADKAVSCNELYEIIVKHRFSLVRVGNVDYNFHQPKTINFIPHKELISTWAEDYKTMQEQMIYGDAPTFDQLIEYLKVLNDKINELPWETSFSFKQIDK